MSETDSFIEEVSEEVRRDRLFQQFRRYGWIAALVVIVVVGGAAYNEYRKAQAANSAQALGDAMLAALDGETPADRVAALAEIEAGGAAGAVAALLAASELLAEGDQDGALERLNAVASDGEVPLLYRDLAALKALMIDTGDLAARRAGLEALSAPGAAFALLAQEQIALIDLQEGDIDAARERLTRLAEDAAASQGLRDRAQGLIVALGEAPDEAEPGE